MVPLGLNHPLLFLHQIDVLLHERIHACRLGVIHSPKSQLSRDCKVSEREKDGEFVEEAEVNIVFFRIVPVEFLKHDWANFHD
jgi:hypothetical protein